MLNDLFKGFRPYLQNIKETTNKVYILPSFFKGFEKPVCTNDHSNRDEKFSILFRFVTNMTNGLARQRASEDM